MNIYVILPVCVIGASCFGLNLVFFAADTAFFCNSLFNVVDPSIVGVALTTSPSRLTIIIITTFPETCIPYSGLTGLVTFLPLKLKLIPS